MTQQLQNKEAGLTLMEVTLVVAVLLGLISVLFLGAAAYKKGANRAQCLLNITNVQKAVRSYANLYQLAEGDPMSESLIVGTGKMLETKPVCPGEGTYTYKDTVQPVGSVQLICEIMGMEEHKPLSTAGW